MEIVSPEHILLRTFERGAGETMACGSNACAAVVAGIRNKLLKNKVRVQLALGDLFVEWKDDKAPVILSGPATQVYSGVLNISL